MNKNSLSQMMDREDSLALEKYGRTFTSLLGHEKLAVHNEVLEMCGLRQVFKFRCSKCNTVHQENVEGELIEEYTASLANDPNGFVKVVCEDCRERQEQIKQEKELLATIDELSATNSEDSPEKWG